MTKKIINFKHSGKIGDALSALPTILSYHEENEDWILNLYLSKERAEFNDDSIAYIVPLLQHQPYLNEVKEHENERIDINLDEFRRKKDPLHFASIIWAHLLTHHRFYDLAKPFLFNIDDNKKADIIITKTRRYYGYFPWKKFMKEFPTRRMAFIGMDDEYRKFCHDYKTIRRIMVDDALETAEYINSSNIYLGNQSGNSLIAEGLKATRMISTCPHAPTHYVVGKGGYSGFDNNIMKKLKRIL
jgi:hypothetical protein